MKTELVPIQADPDAQALTNGLLLSGGNKSAPVAEDFSASSFEYRPVPPERVVHVKARVRKVLVGTPMRYDFPDDEE